MIPSTVFLFRRCEITSMWATFQRCGSAGTRPEQTQPFGKPWQFWGLEPLRVRERLQRAHTERVRATHGSIIIGWRDVWGGKITSFSGQLDESWVKSHQKNLGQLPKPCQQALRLGATLARCCLSIPQIDRLKATGHGLHFCREASCTCAETNDKICLYIFSFRLWLWCHLQNWMVQSPTCPHHHLQRMTLDGISGGMLATLKFVQWIFGWITNWEPQDQR